MTATGSTSLDRPNLNRILIAPRRQADLKVNGRLASPATRFYRDVVSLAAGPRYQFAEQLPGCPIEFHQLHLLNRREIVCAC